MIICEENQLEYKNLLGVFRKIRSYFGPFYLFLT